MAKPGSRKKRRRKSWLERRVDPPPRASGKPPLLSPEVGRLETKRNRLKLTCDACGRDGTYDVGAIVVSPFPPGRSADDLQPEETYGFTGYFRCKHCDAGGPWRFPPLTTLKLISMMARMAESAHLDPEIAPMTMCEMRLFDGTRVRYATEAEEHLTALIARSPEDPHLHDRLGNTYKLGGRRDLAEAAFRRAIEHDPDWIPSLYSLGIILSDDNRDPEAASFLHRLLLAAPTATVPTPGDLRVMVRSAMETLLDLNERSRGVIPIFPAADLPPADALTPEDADPEPLKLDILQLDLSRDSDWEILVDRILGKTHSRR
jgi:hypothetical protein